MLALTSTMAIMPMDFLGVIAAMSKGGHTSGQDLHFAELIVYAGRRGLPEYPKQYRHDQTAGYQANHRRGQQPCQNLDEPCPQDLVGPYCTDDRSYQAADQGMRGTAGYAGTR